MKTEFTDEEMYKDGIIRGKYCTLDDELQRIKLRAKCIIKDLNKLFNEKLELTEFGK